MNTFFDIGATGDLELPTSGLADLARLRHPGPRSVLRPAGLEPAALERGAPHAARPQLEAEPGSSSDHAGLPRTALPRDFDVSYASRAKLFGIGGSIDRG